MRVCILSVTRIDEDYFGIAGVNLEGQWVRPISDGAGAPYWDDEHLRFDTGYGFLRPGDIVEFTEKAPYNPSYPEDVVVVAGDIVLKKRLPNKDLLWFLESAIDPKEAFDELVEQKGRSLCVMKVDRAKHYLADEVGELPLAKLAITNFDFHLLNPENNASNFTITDTKWNQLIQDGKLENKTAYSEIYVIFGLEPKPGQPHMIEPHVIGVHTNPSVDLPNMYPY